MRVLLRNNVTDTSRYLKKLQPKCDSEILKRLNITQVRQAYKTEGNLAHKLILLYIKCGMSLGRFPLLSELCELIWQHTLAGICLGPPDAYAFPELASKQFRKKITGHVLAACGAVYKLGLPGLIYDELADRIMIDAAMGYEAMGHARPKKILLATCRDIDIASIVFGAKYLDQIIGLADMGRDCTRRPRQASGLIDNLISLTSQRITHPKIPETCDAVILNIALHAPHMNKITKHAADYLIKHSHMLLVNIPPNYKSVLYTNSSFIQQNAYAPIDVVFKNVVDCMEKAWEVLGHESDQHWIKQKTMFYRAMHQSLPAHLTETDTVHLISVRTH